MGAIALYLCTSVALSDSAPMWVRYNFYIKWTTGQEILLGERF